MSNESQQKALETIKAVYDDGLATINGRDYQFTKTTHKKRRKVFAFYSRIAGLVQRNDFSFLDWPEWDQIESLLGDIVMVDDVQLNKRPNHWDEHPGDYLRYISIALPVVSYPFLAESLGG